MRRELGTAIATKIARRMVVPPQRDGGQQQFVEMPIPAVSGDSLSPVLTWVVENLDEPHSAASLAKRAMMSDRSSPVGLPQRPDNAAPVADQRRVLAAAQPAGGE